MKHIYEYLTSTALPNAREMRGYLHWLDMFEVQIF